MTSPTSLKKRSVNIAGHSTSVTLEQAFWDALRDAAAQRGLSISTLIAEIDLARAGDSGAPNLSSAIRVYLLRRAQGL